MNDDQGPAPRRAVAPASPDTAARLLYTGALALAALLGNWLSLPLAFGVDFLFGSIAVMLALAWLGTGSGLVVALAGGAYTWLLWDHPYALLTFLAEAAAVGWHRTRARRRGQNPPPLAVSAALFWLLPGIPLALLAHGVMLGMAWNPTLLIAVKQAENGILNAALADLVLVVTALLARRRAALPLAQVLFGVLLAAMMVPSLLVNAWENRDLRDRLETALADHLRLFGELAVHALIADQAQPAAAPATWAARLEPMQRALAESLPADYEPRMVLEPVGAARPRASTPPSALTWIIGRRPGPGQVVATAAPGLSLILPAGHFPSRVALWRQGVYRMEIPAHAVADPDAAPGGAAADLNLIMELRAAPLIDQVQAAAARLLVLLLAVALLGLVVAHRLSRRIARPLHRLAEGTRALPAAIGADRPWPALVPELLAETDALAKAVTGMAQSLAASFRALREERDQREALNLALSLEEARFRTLFATMAEGVVYRDARGAIMDANPAALRLLGLRLDEVRGLAITALPWELMREDGTRLPPAEHPASIALAAGQTPGGAVMGIRIPATGRTRWLLVNARSEFRPGEVEPYRVFTTFADITRLKETEDRLRTLIEIAPHGIAEADPETRRLRWCSGSMLRLFGYDPETVHDLSVADLHPPESLPLVLSEFARMAAGDLRPAPEVPCRRRDGSIFYCRISPGLMRLGEAATPVAYFTDVTAEREARLALEHSQASLLKAQEIARLGSWEHDLIQDRLAWSPEQYRIFELAPGGFDHHRADLVQCVHPDDRARFERTYRDALAARTPYELVYRLRLADGRLKWVHDRSETDYAADGTPLRSRGTTQDITELRAATERREALEEALSRYAAQLEELVDVISLPLAPADQVRTLLWLGCDNLGMTAALLVQVDEEQGQRELFAAREDSHVGAPPRLTDALLVEALTHLGSPRVLGPERLPPPAHASGLDACVLMAFDCIRPDGQTDTLVLSLWGPEPPPDPGGPGQQIVRLIAQRIAAVRHQDQVHHDLMEAKGRESIGHLASGIAHDFNNLLGVIDANIYYLEGRLGGLAPADPELRQVMAETQSALGQAKVITSGMLSLSRAGGVPLEAVDLGPTVGELERILRQVLPPGIRLRVALAPGLRAWTNGAFLQSALLNLVFNARDAMPGGGVLDIAAAPCQWDPGTPLAVGRRPSGDCIALEVSDTGSGIEPGLLGRIFDPLFSTKARQRGHGLGLFMVAEFVNRSGAGLGVESAPGQGTRFSLLLSCESAHTRCRDDRAGTGSPATPDPSAAAMQRSAPLAGLRVLVVEDDPRVREAVGRLLTLDGASVLHAEHGQAALDRLARGDACDLVLSDIAMPVLDGLQLYLRLAQGHPDLPVILMTGQKDALSALDDLALRPTILRKPVDPVALRAAVLAEART